MKILHITSSMEPSAGGPVEFITQLNRIMPELGSETEAVCLDDPASTALSHHTMKVYALGPSQGGWKYSPRLIPWLKENGKRYDAIIVNGLWQFGSYAAWRVFRNSPTPVFVFCHGMLDPWFRYNYPLKHYKKLLYWLPMQRRFLRDARAVVFTCEEERRLARLSFPAYRCTERVVHYGTADPPAALDDQASAFFSHLPQLEGKRIWLFLGRLHEKKGCDLLLQAFAQVAPQEESLRLVIAGPDKVGILPKLQAMAQELGIEDRVVWAGMLTGAKKWGALRAAEVFILPSHQENFGIAVAEALACGTPVLVSNKVNIWREIVEMGAGFAAEDDLQGTKELLSQWENLTPQQRSSMRVTARSCFMDSFEVHRTAQELLEIMQEGSAREVTTPQNTKGEIRDGY